MKNKLFILFLAIIATVITACETNPPEDNPNPGKEPIHLEAEQLVGFWKFPSPEDYKEDIPCYYQFYSDGTYEKLFALFSPTIGNHIRIEGYYCITGTFSVTDTILKLNLSKGRQYFYKNDVLRILSIYELSEFEEQYCVAEQSEDKLVLKSGEYYDELYKMSQKPDEWDPIFFEPEKTLSEEALIGQWDLVNRCNSDYSWWWYGNPSEEGIQLLDEGKTTNYLSSFVFDLTKQALVEAGETFAENEVISIYNQSYSCGWSLHDRTITFVCTAPKYDVYYCPNDSDCQYVRTITPEAPTPTDYTVYSFSDHFLILQSNYDGTYYVFSPGTEPPVENANSSSRLGRNTNKSKQ